MSGEWNRLVKNNQMWCQPAKKVAGRRLGIKRQIDNSNIGLIELIKRARGWEEKWEILAEVRLERVPVRLAEYNYALRTLILEYTAIYLREEIRSITHGRLLEFFQKIRSKLYHVWIDDIRLFPLDLRVATARGMFFFEYVLKMGFTLPVSIDFANEHNLFYPSPPHDADLRFSSLQEVVIFGIQPLSCKWPMLNITDDLRIYVRTIHIRMCELGARVFHVNEKIPRTNTRIMDYEAMLDQKTKNGIRQFSDYAFTYHHSFYLGAIRCFVKNDRIRGDNVVLHTPRLHDDVRENVENWLKKALEGGDSKTIAGHFKDKFYGFFERLGMFDMYLLHMIEDEQVIGTDLPRNSDNMYSAYNTFYQSDAGVIQKHIMNKIPIQVVSLEPNEPFFAESHLLYFLCAFFHVLFVQARIDTWESRWRENPTTRDMISEPVTFGRIMHEFFIYDAKNLRMSHTSDEVEAVYAYLKALEENETDALIREKIVGLRGSMFESGTYQRKAVVKKYDPREDVDPHARAYIT